MPVQKQAAFQSICVKDLLWRYFVMTCPYNEDQLKYFGFFVHFVCIDQKVNTHS